MHQLSQKFFNKINQLREQTGQKALEYFSSYNSQTISLDQQITKLGNTGNLYN